ncbi:Dual-action HEIGH metallo-peptidase [Chitinophaga sp. CF118]|uniref:M57 family metalloprotease n=1 Tax=Chitinophaga sp. CF118 TaxID=1884367 RepID=UPI0008E778A1|nr:M57 family metalloprotease [Chitinophaga sp. CF118]SFD58162.1 Dual-action HEIGH metallo-peptidase [Chitinophaga sp. CF118]
MRTKTLHLSSANPVLAIVLFISIFMFSCKKEEASTQPQADGSIASLTDYLTGKGFKAEDIVFKDGKFTIEKDIVITSEEVAARMKNESNSGTPQTEQRRNTYIISNTYNTNVKLYIEPDVPAAWKTAVQGAVANWNAVNGTRLGMSIVTTLSASNTRIFMGFESANWIARAYLPTSNGRPGVSVEINSNFNSLAASQKLFAITHELGHTIGFHHTNQTSGTLIPGTPSVDANSVMNSFVLNWNGFTAGDVLATQILYPQ